MDMKRCSKCGSIKPVTEFGERLKNKDGHKGRCYSCCNKAEKTWQAKRKAEIATQQREVQDIPEPRRRCPRCKENRPWNEYPEVTVKNQGIDFMCNECRERAEKVGKAKANKIRAKKRLATNYRAKIKRDALSWRAYMKSVGRCWIGTVNEDAKQWREHGEKAQARAKNAEKESQLQAKLEAAWLQAEAKEGDDQTDLLQAIEKKVRTARLQAEIDSWPKSDKLLPLK